MFHEFDFDFYSGRRVLITGHTGFKGSWMCKFLKLLGAKVFGYALKPPTTPSLFDLACIGKDVNLSIVGDIRDLNNLLGFFDTVKPEVVIHMAAQPIVRDSYVDTVYTYETNVMGTVNVLEAVRRTKSVISFLNVTTDKVYLNNEWCWPYRENDKLDGFDPYSNSKSCSELVTHSYVNSFMKQLAIPVSTARAGNVIGGGDFSSFRIIPDCVRAIKDNNKLVIRNPRSIRPYQHVLEPVYAYLMICARQTTDASLAGAYNIGPNEADCITTEELVKIFNRCYDNTLNYVIEQDHGPHEANFLKLDCSKVRSTFGWKPRWTVEEAVDRVTQWCRVWLGGGNVADFTESTVRDFINI